MKRAFYLSLFHLTYYCWIFEECYQGLVDRLGILYNCLGLFKGANTVYFISSLYTINQKPIMPRTHFHCIPTRVAHSSG